MKPESGKTASVWMSTFEVPQFKSLTSDEECDVCVIGAGITGLTTAYMLTRSGKNVIVVDDGSIGGGESARTTAHITNVIDDRYHRIESLHGKDNARLAAESQTAAIDTIEDIINTNKIDCDFTRLTGYHFFMPDENAEDLEKEYEACKRAGINVKINENPPIASMGNYPCLEFPNQAEFHMLKYLAGLADAITKAGGKIYTQTHIQSIKDSKDGSPATAETKDKLKITAKDIVVATNSPVSDYVKMHLKQVAHRTYVIGITVPKDSVPHGLYWDTEEPYHYIRLYKQQKNDILIIGGEDHKTGQDDHPEKHFDNLVKWASEKFPVGGNVAYKWSGQVLEPFDGLSFIGKDPENPEHIYIATGDSGMGITHGTFSAVILDDLINGRKNKWAELYDPKRLKLIKNAPDYIKEGLNTAVQYIDIITPPEVSSVDEIVPGSGAIMGNGMNKIAAYKDENGTMYKFSAVCPHLKCIVEWNNVEKTWDCPCHGSRFDFKGKVINGPALADLKPVKEEQEESKTHNK
jgi:glycine/D-amino acid oxidase-like deaminating enzyme/nitrite reductase/ring-hydroxylating ferredoxin subunit